MTAAACGCGGLSVSYACMLAFVMVRWYTDTFGQAFLVFLVAAVVAGLRIVVAARKEEQQAAAPRVRKAKESNGTLVKDE